jgi:glycosyltransferase involved in cell wall biosynthesis
MKIAFITAESHRLTDGTFAAGGTTWHRAVLPARALTANGHQTVVTDRYGQTRTGEILPMLGPWGGDGKGGGRFDGELLTGFDVIVFIRCMKADTATAMTRARAHGGQLLVQDLDDWLWGIPTTNVGYWHTHPAYNPEFNRDHLRRQIPLAHLVTVSTPYLAERVAHRWPTPVAILPNTVPLDAFTAADVHPGPARTVGWVGGTGWRSGDLETLRGTLGPYMRRHGMTFVHGGDDQRRGAPAAADMLGLGPDVPVELRPLVPPDRYPSLFAGIDIGIAPLSTATFNLAKSPCKVMEYGAAGVPWVASDVGPYAGGRYPDGRGMGGRTARRPKDWLRHLETLVDPDERAAQRAAQLAALEPLDVRRRWVDWLNAYSVAVGGQELARV